MTTQFTPQVMTLSASDIAPPSRKSVLFCFDCGHESPIEGDWNRRPHGDTVDYECPACSTTITSRPRSDRQPTECKPTVTHRASD